MTDEAQDPKRKRRRWIIAVVLLFVVGVAGWCCWPRVDQRFVGTWRYEDDWTAGRLKTNTYRADGTWEFRGQEVTLSGTWRVRGNQLCFRDSDTLASPVRALIAGLTGHYDNALRIKSINGERMELQRSDGEILTYRRIPE
jgi:hypothetical protein